MTGLPPMPGNPGGVRVVADRLHATARRLDALGRVLARLRDGATWEGVAGEEFGVRLRAAVPVLDAVAARLGGAVAPLRALADALEEAQAVIAVAVQDESDADQAYAVLEDRAYALVVAGSGEDDPALLLVRHLQQEQVRVQAGARARHGAAAERFREADSCCARVLRSLSVDEVADSAPYRLLAAASTVGHDVATLGLVSATVPELRPVAAAGEAAGVAADTALLVAYGEGDWAELGGSAALMATGGMGAVLRRGAVAGAERTAQGAVSTRYLTTRQRLALGAAAEARASRDAVRAALDVAPARGTPTALTGGPAVGTVRAPVAASGLAAGVRDAARARAARGRAAVAAQLDRAFRDDWRLATANGPAAQRLYTGGASLQVGTAAARATRPVTEAEPAGR